MTTPAGPTVVRRQLGRTLKRLRGAARVSVDQVVANRELGISRAKLYRLEAGQHPVKPQDVTVLCQYLGVPAEEISRLTGLALATQNHGDAAIPEWFQLYRDLEPIASTIRSFQVAVVPGYLQTADYARAVFRAGPPFESDEAVEHQVTLRLDRQDRLFGSRPAPRLVTILGEEALTRPVGGAVVMRQQVEHLRQVDTRGSVSIKVLPFSAGAHAGMEGTFRIIDFDDPDDPNIVYLEAHASARYLHKSAEYADYQRIWDLVDAHAVPLKEFSP